MNIHNLPIQEQRAILTQIYFQCVIHPLDTEGFQHQWVENSIWYDIPGYSRYRITMRGDLINRQTGVLKVFYLAKNIGYLSVRVTRDDGASTIQTMHRLLALAFLLPPSNYSTLDVNHINGDKLDNRLENLEWATRAENCTHAYSTGLRSDNIPIRVTDGVTGETTVAYSMGEAGRWFGVTAASIYQQVHGVARMPYKGHYFEYA